VRFADGEVRVQAEGEARTAQGVLPI